MQRSYSRLEHFKMRTLYLAACSNSPSLALCRDFVETVESRRAAQGALLGALPSLGCHGAVGLGDTLRGGFLLWLLRRQEEDMHDSMENQLII